MIGHLNMQHIVLSIISCIFLLYSYNVSYEQAQFTPMLVLKLNVAIKPIFDLRMAASTPGDAQHEKSTQNEIPDLDKTKQWEDARPKKTVYIFVSLIDNTRLFTIQYVLWSLTKTVKAEQHFCFGLIWYLRPYAGIHHHRHEEKEIKHTIISTDVIIPIQLSEPSKKVISLYLLSRCDLADT